MAEDLPAEREHPAAVVAELSVQAELPLDGMGADEIHGQIGGHSGFPHTGDQAERHRIRQRREDAAVEEAAGIGVIRGNRHGKNDVPAAHALHAYAEEIMDASVGRVEPADVVRHELRRHMKGLSFFRTLYDLFDGHGPASFSGAAAAPAVCPLVSRKKEPGVSLQVPFLYGDRYGIRTHTLCAENAAS